MVEQCCKVGADTSMVGDDAIRNLMDHVRANLPHHVDYFTNHVTSKLENNMDVLRKHGWIAHGWTNNNAESYSHVLKHKTEWKQMKHVIDLIDSVHMLVKLQIQDLK